MARAFAGHRQQTSEIIRRAIEHKGYSLVDVFQPCVSFNKLNTYKWFEENTYYLDDSHDPRDRVEAFRIAATGGKFALGVLYVNRDRKPFEAHLPAYAGSDLPLFKREVDRKKLAALIASKV